MQREHLLRRQGEWLEQQIWEHPRAHLPALEQGLQARLEPLGLTVRELLAEVSDEGLILAIQERFLAGEAFEELLENRYKPLLVRWSYHWGLSFQDAEDLVHTVFLKLWKTRFGSYKLHGENVDNFRAYVWTTAHHQWVQDLRKQKKIKLGCLEACPEPSANGHSVEQIAEGTELRQRLEAALLRLRPRKTQQVMRASLDGQTLGEIAQQLGLSYRAVAIRLCRARKFLAQTLELPQRSRSSRGFS